MIIAGFKVSAGPKAADAGTTIVAEYDVRGILSQDYVRSPRTETVRFVVRRTDAGWKITDPDFMPPHVMREPLFRHLEETKNRELALRVGEGAKE
jgi:hypothetical protein